MRVTLHLLIRAREALRKALYPFALAVAITAVTGTSARAQFATDNADNAPYADGGYIGDNGGSGYGPWEVSDALGGGTFVTNTRQTDGLRSFSIAAGSGGYSVGRFTPNMAQRTFTVSSRHDLSSETGFSGFSFRPGGPGPVSPSFGGGFELLRFGLPGTAQPATPFNTVMVQSPTGQQLLTLTGGDGEIRGDVLNWTVTFDAFTLNYSMLVTSSDGGHAFTTGTLTLNTGVNAIAFVNFNTGTNQDFHFDNPTISALPEPATPSAAAAALLFTVQRRGRKMLSGTRDK
jgi:hypothetical protein